MRGEQAGDTLQATVLVHEVLSPRERTGPDHHGVSRELGKPHRAGSGPAGFLIRFPLDLLTSVRVPRWAKKRYSVESRVKECRTLPKATSHLKCLVIMDHHVVRSRTHPRWRDYWTSGCTAMRRNSERHSKSCDVLWTKNAPMATSSFHEPDRSAGRRSAWNDHESEEFPRKRSMRTGSRVLLTRESCLQLTRDRHSGDRGLRSPSRVA